MGKLESMQVGRVDGVDRPAIKKRWVLVKNEGTTQPVEKDYKTAASAVVEAIAKEGVSFSDETMELLKALVETLELDVEFAAKSEEDDDDNDGNDDSDVTYTADEAEGLVKAALEAAGVDTSKIVAKSDDGTPESRASRITVAKSRQPKSQEDVEGEPRKLAKGEGLYSNIINGDATQPFRG